jgi:hypothetical protein
MPPIRANDWEAMRPIICRLYFEEDKPLAEVQQILKNEHAFNATYDFQSENLIFQEDS